MLQLVTVVETTTRALSFRFHIPSRLVPSRNEIKTSQANPFLAHHQGDELATFQALLKPVVQTYSLIATIPSKGPSAPGAFSSSRGRVAFGSHASPRRCCRANWLESLLLRVCAICAWLRMCILLTHMRLDALPLETHILTCIPNHKHACMHT